LAPKTWNGVAQDDRQRDRRHDPAEFGLDLERRADGDAFDEGALQAAEDDHHRQHQPVIEIRSAMDRADQAQADERAQHQRLALAEVERARSGERQLITESNHRVNHAERDAAEDQLQQNFHISPRRRIGAG
jgi:hypothetical protein